ncbi:hypothetical protein BC829DRAFT_384597 [Chytridium lagenaria]|nr:hypothetical protein BC829DRAFT_384597 [Chytridium lagenaria]
MSVIPSNSSWLNVTLIASVCAVGYLIYFDQRRQYDAEFRRSLRRERKLAAKVRTEEDQKAQMRAKAALDFLTEDDDKLPTTEKRSKRDCAAASVGDDYGMMAMDVDNAKAAAGGIT